MFHDVDRMLRNLLLANLVNLPGCPVRNTGQIAFDHPLLAETMQTGEARINLYLHDVRENVTLRQYGDQPISRDPRQDPVVRRRALPRISLSYLVTVYAGEDPATEHRLLADVLGALMRQNAPPASCLMGALSELTPPEFWITVAQPEHISEVDPKNFWQALGAKLRPSLPLQVVLPFDPYYETESARRVRTVVSARGGGINSVDAPGVSVNRLSVAGVTLDKVGGEAIPGVIVTVDGGGIDRVGTQVSTDVEGVFVLINLPPGPHLLHFTRYGYRPFTVTVEASADNASQQVDPVVVALEPMTDAELAAVVAAVRGEARLTDGARSYGVTLSGLLRLPGGAPAAYVPVRVQERRTVTDAGGIYVFTDLPEGPHTVYAEYPGVGETPVL